VRSEADTRTKDIQSAEYGVSDRLGIHLRFANDPHCGVEFQFQHSGFRGLGKIVADPAKP
jgi:hypothetical protein